MPQSEDLRGMLTREAYQSLPEINYRDKYFQMKSDTIKRLNAKKGEMYRKIITESSLNFNCYKKMIQKLKPKIQLSAGKTQLIPEEKHYFLYNNSLCVFFVCSDITIRPGTEYTIHMGSQSMPATIKVAKTSDLIKLSGEMKLINVGDEIIEGRWQSDEIEFIIVNIHYIQYSRAIAKLDIKPKFSDLVSNYGLADYTALLELRRGGTTFQSMQFRGIDAVVESGFAAIHYEFAEPLRAEPVFIWKTLVFSGKVPRLCIVDVSLRDESSEVVWYVSKLGKISRCKLLDYTGQNYELRVGNENGDICLTLADREGSWFISEGVIRLKLSFLNRIFSTKYK